MKRITVVAFALVALTGCGSDKNDDNSGGKAQPAPTTPASGGATSPGSANTVAVTIKDIKFQPHDITVKEGQKVRWTNDDNVPHTVTATKNGSVDSGTLKPGAFYETTMRNAGTIDYVCQIHPGQTGTIKIVP
jgi:plastocyanin